MYRGFEALLTGLMLGAGIVTASGREVRVEARNGVPQIHVDGKPVRARIFFGIPGRGGLPIGPEARQIRFTFTAVEDEPDRATMHFRFGKSSGEVVLDDIRVEEVDTGRAVFVPLDFEDGGERFAADWMVWPPDERNTVGDLAAIPDIGWNGSSGLRVTLSDPPGGKWPGFHFYHRPVLELRRGHEYEVTLWVRARGRRLLRIGFYRPGSVFTQLAFPPGVFEQQVKLAGDVGVNIVSFPVALPWPPPGEPPEYAAVDAVCGRILDVNPDALLLPRIPMEPPKWWKQRYPEHVMRWEDGIRPRGFAVASRQYRADACEALSGLIEHLEARFGDSMAGYHPAGHNTGEWFYQDTWKRRFHGYSPVMRRAFRQWLRGRYHAVADLRHAWKSEGVDFETAAVPAPDVLHAAPNGLLRDPMLERPAVDFNRFLQEAMAECVTALAETVRETTDGRRLSVFFYGYVFEFGGVFNGPAMSGHYALRRILDCPDIDVLCSPISYFDRGLAESAPSMTAAESVLLAGKLWLNEDDTATYLSSGTFPGHSERVDTFEGSNSQLVRNVAQETCRNLGTWWMDLGGTGWFNDPRFWRSMQKLEAIDLPLLESPVVYRPKVAAVVDEKSMMLVAEGGSRLTGPLVRESRGALARMGAPYGQYLLDDVIAGRTDARVYVFLNAWQLDAARRGALRQKTAGSCRIWCYASGLFDGNARSLQAMKELTGFRLEPVSASGVGAVATPTAVGKSLGLTEAWLVKGKLAPLFVVADAAPGEILATYPNGQAAVVMRQAHGTVDVFLGVPRLTSELLRLAANAAGMHIFSRDECIVYANGPFLAVHATHDGPVHIDPGREFDVVRDIMAGRDLDVVDNALKLDLKRGETRVLRVR